MTYHKKIYLFSTCALIIHSILFFINPFLQKKTNKLWNQVIKLNKKENIETLFIGHSHVANAIDYELFKDSYSLAYSGENNMKNYYKLNYCIKNNFPQPKYAIFPCELVTFSKEYYYFFKERSFYYSIIPSNEIFECNKNKIDGYYNYYKIKLFPYIEWLQILNGKPRKEKNTLVRDFSKLTPFRQQQNADIFAKDELKISDKESLFYTPSLYYIQQTIELCKANHIKPVFVKYPITRLFFKTLKSNLIDSTCIINSPSDSIIKKNKIPILDFENIYFANPEKFADSHHLNESGKQAFSKMLKTKLDSLYKIY